MKTNKRNQNKMLGEKEQEEKRFYSNGTIPARSKTNAKPLVTRQSGAHCGQCEFPLRATRRPLASRYCTSYPLSIEPRGR